MSGYAVDLGLPPVRVPIGLSRKRRIITPGEWLRDKLAEQKAEREAAIALAIGTPVSLGSKANGTAAASITSNAVSAAVAIGNRIYAFAGCQTAGTTCTFSDSKGNTWATDVSANATNNACFFLGSAPCTIALTTSDTLTATFSASRGDQLIAGVSVSGILSASALDKTAVNPQTGNGLAWTSSASPTTTQADELVIGGSVNNALATITSTPGASLTELFDFATANAVCMTVVYRIVSATGAYTANGTWTTSSVGDTANSGVGTYKAAAAAKSLVAPGRSGGRRHRLNR